MEKYVFFDVILERTGVQIQYAVQYAAGKMGEGLRFRNLDPGNFRGEIHESDLEEFVRRLNNRPSARFFKGSES